MANNYITAEDWLSLFDNTAEMEDFSGFTGFSGAVQHPSVGYNPPQSSNVAPPPPSAPTPPQDVPVPMEPQHRLLKPQQSMDTKSQLHGVGDRMSAMETQLQEIIDRLSGLESTINNIAESLGADSWESSSDDDKASQSSSEYSEPKSETTSDGDLAVFGFLASECLDLV
ncbi:hypothetical protein Purlil1_13968 [Purpureocillium lilacinum]|uniref:Uncharacterized protein n=1 Tax=Purpureocillium lilacinum TaxID=33203 RepID=A0ABR0BCL5_PURLI|nr:hypothetical protein Purlil1_13968 [Purpureocillium lilacinum]